MIRRENSKRSQDCESNLTRDGTEDAPVKEPECIRKVDEAQHSLIIEDMLVMDHLEETKNRLEELKLVSVSRAKNATKVGYVSKY